jgi:hypothetical protein
MKNIPKQPTIPSDAEQGITIEQYNTKIEIRPYVPHLFTSVDGEETVSIEYIPAENGATPRIIVKLNGANSALDLDPGEISDILKEEFQIHVYNKHTHLDTKYSNKQYTLEINS